MLLTTMMMMMVDADVVLLLHVGGVDDVSLIVYSNSTTNKLIFTSATIIGH